MFNFNVSVFMSRVNFWLKLLFTVTECTGERTFHALVLDFFSIMYIKCDCFLTLRTFVITKVFFCLFFRYVGFALDC